MKKPAELDHPIHDLLAQRWSPVGFEPKPLPQAELCSCLEAARWAASAFNEQPWTFLVAQRENTAEFEKMLSVLVEANQAWAKNASVLLLTCANQQFIRNSKPNTAALHDLGLAVGNLSVEATARGLIVHQMKGFLPDKAREAYDVPEQIELVTAIALGYAADPETLPDDLKQRDLAERHRKPLAKFVFEGEWGHSADLG
ncbi:MAG: nitroreductase family protein [Planctomycetaceae bacterium]